MHLRTTPLQNWERAALTEYAQKSEVFRAASSSVWFALRLRVALVQAALTRSDVDAYRLPCARSVPPSACPEIETRLYTLFAE